MRESSKAALCGIVAALAVVIMMITYISPVLVYTAPPFAGLILLLIVNEVSFSRAVGTYFAVSLLSLFLIADKEAATFFTCFFGFYPISFLSFYCFLKYIFSQKCEQGHFIRIVKKIKPFIQIF